MMEIFHFRREYDKTKEDLINIIEQYAKSDKDVTICVSAMGCIIKDIMQTLSDKHGADKLIEIMEAKEVNS